MFYPASDFLQSVLGMKFHIVYSLEQESEPRFPSTETKAAVSQLQLLIYINFSHFNKQIKNNLQPILIKACSN